MRLIITVVVLLLAGCASKATDYHVPPAGEASSDAATIIGQRIYRESDFEGDARVNILLVDDRLVRRKSREDWSVPVLVAPGQHELGISIVVGSFDPKTGWGLLEATVEPGETYKVIANYPEDDRPFTVWLENTAGERVSDKILIAVGYRVSAPPIIRIFQ